MYVLVNLDKGTYFQAVEVLTPAWPRKYFRFRDLQRMGNTKEY